MENDKDKKDNEIYNFWMHITHGQFEINEDESSKKLIVSTYVFDDYKRLDYDFLQEYPFRTDFFEVIEFNKIIKAKFGKEVKNMNYSKLMGALAWYKKQAISGSKLKDRVFIKFYGDLEDDRALPYGRRPLNYDTQLKGGNIIRDEPYGVGLAAGNIENCISCYNDEYGDKFLLLKALEDYEYMFSGRFKYNEVLRRNVVDMTGGMQIIGMAFKVIYKGTIDAEKRFKLQKIEESGTLR